MSKEQKFTRKDFEAIRKMDRASTERYFREIHDKGYEEGYKAGVESCASKEAEPISLERLAEELGKIRGIGVIKAKLVAQAVERFVIGGGRKSEKL